MSYPHLIAPTTAPTSAPMPVDWRPAWIQSITDDGPIDVSICIANWNCQDYLRSCLESLHDLPQGVRVETIVVDNASSDGADDMVEHEFPEVVLVRNDANVGFAKASNQAAELARGRFVFFLNNDTLIPAGTLRRLLQFAEENPEFGMIGPRLRGSDGQPQISYRQRPTMAALLHKMMMFRWTGMFRKAYRDYRRTGFVADGNREVEVLMGAAVLLRRECFEESGGWDEDYLFGGEDIDLSTRIGRSYPLAFVGDVEITHYGRVSTRQNIDFAAPNVTIGYVHYFRKNGYSPMALWFYKLAVTLDVPLQMAVKSLEWAWRAITGQREKAEKTRLALKGIWRFVRGETLRFWRA